jgi:hypothetical protein
MGEASAPVVPWLELWGASVKVRPWALVALRRTTGNWRLGHHQQVDPATWSGSWGRAGASKDDAGELSGRVMEKEKPHPREEGGAKSS